MHKKDHSILLLRSLMFWILRAYALRMTFALNLFDRSVILTPTASAASAQPCQSVQALCRGIRLARYSCRLFS